MDKSLLKSVITDQRELLDRHILENKVVPREGMAHCLKAITHPNILLISGMRRAGKSFFAHLLLEGKKYAFINFDDERLLGLTAKDLNLMLECFYDLYTDFDTLLLDEIQNIAGWELFANRMRNKFKVVITGSNANLLSHELATHLTGRFLEHQLYPLSFREFLEFKSYHLKETDNHSTELRAKIGVLFDDYLQNGGVFEYYKFGSDFLRTLFSSIITKDIIVRYGVKHPKALEELGLLLINYFASKLSVSKITKSIGIKSPNTTADYIRYLENSFLIFTLHKYSFKLKEQFSSFKKVYAVDNGLIRSLSLGHSDDRGRLLENLVAVELRRRAHEAQYEVYYWDDYNVECDFLIKHGRKVSAAYQVCFDLNLKNQDREVAGLVAALKEFKLKEGTILTHSTQDDIHIDGLKISVVPVWQWLLQPQVPLMD